MKPPVLLGIGSAIALALMLALVVNVRSQTADGLGDFAAFYAGARSLPTGDLYDIERLHQIELEHTGKYSSGHGYVRPPFHAVLIWPLSRLPYRSAYTLWNLILAASIAGFIALWRPPPIFGRHCCSPACASQPSRRSSMDKMFLCCCSGWRFA